VSVGAELKDQSQVEVGVQGPGTATRLFLCTGRAQFELPSGEMQVRFLVGPVLTHPQFVEASATAGLAVFRWTSGGRSAPRSVSHTN
jgi:hypothetical protein